MRVILLRISFSAWHPYAFFSDAKHPTSSGCSRCEECAGMQRVIIFFSSQSRWKSIELWLSWPSITSRRWLPTTLPFVCLSKCSSHSIPSLFVVQPFSETPITQSCGRSSSLYQAERWCLPAKMIKGGIAYPIALMLWIAVTYSRLLCCTVLGRP